MADIVLICGSRAWTEPEDIRARIMRLAAGTIVISGEAEGADKLARVFAVTQGLFVAEMPVRRHHWNVHGRRAGHLRNSAMLALQPGLVIAFQRNGSRGTQDTIAEARRRGIAVEVHTA